MRASCRTIAFSLEIAVTAAALAQPSLEPGATVEGRLGPGERQVYLVALKTREYARLGLEQTGNGVSIAVFDTAGMKIFEAETIMSLPVSLVSEATGEMRIELRRVEPAGVPATYHLQDRGASAVN